jgi:hypothetical protein
MSKEPTPEESMTIAKDVDKQQPTKPNEVTINMDRVNIIFQTEFKALLGLDSMGVQWSLGELAIAQSTLYEQLSIEMDKRKKTKKV